MYALFDNFNDTIEHAEALADLIKERKNSYLYHMNLVRYNEGLPNSRFKRSPADRVKKFRAALSKKGMKHTIRQSFGLKINAACGQLYAGYTSSNLFW